MGQMPELMAQGPLEVWGLGWCGRKEDIGGWHGKGRRARKLGRESSSIQGTVLCW